MHKVSKICNLYLLTIVKPKKTALMRNVCVLFSLLLLFSSCRFIRGERITGNGNSRSEQRDLRDFSGVEVAGHFDVYVTQGTDYSVKLEGDENLLQYVEIQKDGEMLEIGTREGYSLNPRAGLKVYVTAPRLQTFSVAGSGELRSQNKLTGERMKVDVAGSGNTVLEVDAPQVDLDIAGSGTITLKGTTRSLSTDIAGSGEVHAFELMSEEAKVDIAGSGNVELYASKVLKVSTAGSGDVQYRGNPSVSHDKAGSGSLRKVD